MAEFHAGCATAKEILLARDVLMFFGCHMDSAAACGICRREGVGKVKALEVRTLRLQQVVKSKTLTLKTGKSENNCADLEDTGCWDTEFAQKLEWFGGQERNGQRSLRSAISGESRKLRATALKVLERTLDETAGNDQIMSGGEKLFGGIETEQLYAMCANSLQRLIEHQLLERLTSQLESAHAGGVHEIRGNPVTILSSPLMMT